MQYLLNYENYGQRCWLVVKLLLIVSYNYELLDFNKKRTSAKDSRVVYYKKTFTNCSENIFKNDDTKGMNNGPLRSHHLFLM